MAKLLTNLTCFPSGKSQGSEICLKSQD